MKYTVLFLFIVAGCSTYEPSPLDDEAILQELRNPSIELPADGLTPSDVVALALVHNPDLSLWRTEHEIAAKLVISAGVWQNPQFRPSLKNIYSRIANPLTFGFDLRIFPGIPGEIAAKEGRALARERRILAEIEHKEKTLAVEAGIAHARLVMLDSKIQIADALSQLNSQIEATVRAQLEAGAATTLDRVLVDLQTHKIDDRKRQLNSDRKVAAARLASLIGAAPDSQIGVRSSTKTPDIQTINQSELEHQALEMRSDLSALKERYLEAEKKLELTHLAHSFWPQFLQTTIGSLGSNASFGLDAGIDLPIFDSGSADIDVSTARRDMARQKFRSHLHTIRGEIRQAVLAYEVQAERREYFTRTLEPALKKTSSSLQEVFQDGDIDVIRFLSYESNIWDAKNDATEAAFEFEKARLMMRSATGQVFVDQTPVPDEMVRPKEM